MILIQKPPNLLPNLSILQINNIKLPDQWFPLKGENPKFWVAFGEDFVDERDPISGFDQIDDHFEAGDADVAVEAFQGFVVFQEFVFQDRQSSGAFFAVDEGFGQKVFYGDYRYEDKPGRNQACKRSWMFKR